MGYSLGVKHRIYSFVFVMAIIFIFTFASSIEWDSVSTENKSINLKPVYEGVNSTLGEMTDQETRPSEEEVAKKVHDYINQERKNRDLNTLEWDSELSSIADSHSKYMASTGVVGHYENGEGFSARYQEAGYTCRINTGAVIQKGGENAAKTYWKERMESNQGSEYYDTADELARGLANQWMNSRGHRENILKSYWRKEGIGIEITESGEVYATQNFC